MEYLWNTWLIRDDMKFILQRWQVLIPILDYLVGSAPAVAADVLPLSLGQTVDCALAVNHSQFIKYAEMEASKESLGVLFCVVRNLLHFLQHAKNACL